MIPKQVLRATATVLAVACASWAASGKAASTSAGASAPLAAPKDAAIAVAAGAGFGTLGWGLAIAAGSPDHLQLRGVYNQGSLIVHTTQDDIDYEVNLDLRTAGLILDFYPGGSYFRISAGWVFNGNDFTGEARPAKSETIGDRKYAPEEIGTLRASVDVDNQSPYVGIGFGNPLDREGRLKVVADIGVLIHQRVDLDLGATGLLAHDPSFQANLEAERSDIEDDIVNRLRFYPVISIGITVRF